MAELLGLGEWFAVFAPFGVRSRDCVVPEVGRFSTNGIGFTVNDYMPLLTIPPRRDRILIWQIMVERMTSEVFESTAGSNFGEGQSMFWGAQR
jgi:hypothetical protein